MVEATPSEPGLRLRFLGGCEIALPDGPVHLETAKTRALLVYLASNPGPVARSTLVGLLWGELPETNARRNLRRALWNLRRELASPSAPHPIWSDRETVCVNQEGRHWSDVEAFEAAVSVLNREPAPDEMSHYLADAHSAAQLYGGEFLAGFFVSDAVPFEEWALAERERLRLKAVRFYGHLVTVCADHDEVERAIAYARRLLRLEPWLEEAHATLMRLLARAGRRSEALAQFATCKRLLAEQVGVEPSMETQELYEQIRAGSVEAPTSNLPVATTPFVGRARELEAISRLMARAECRLLTVTGLGGVGKTRLARAAAGQLLPGFADGVHYLDVGAVSTPDRDPAGSVDQMVAHVGALLARSLNPSAAGAGGSDLALVAYLREKQMLLVLDSFERVLDGAPLLTRLLRAAPRLKCLVASRERLNLRGEWVYPLGGLAHSLGDRAKTQRGAKATPPAREAAELDAVKLFVQTAQRVHLGFQIVDDEVGHLLDICRMVEGLPLALELAAGWARVLPLARISDEIAQHLDFLSATTRDRPERQRSIRAVVDQSWHLLSEEERRAFRRLSVFEGAFRAEEAIAVSEVSLQVVSALVDKSLLQRLPSGRFQLHELLRQYGQEQLARRPEDAQTARARHGKAYAAVLARYEAALRDNRQGRVFDVIQEDAGNILVAWRWALAHRDLGAVESMRQGLADCFHLTASFREGEAHFRQALQALGWEKPNRQHPLLRCKLATSRATFAVYLGQVAEARAELEHCLAVAEQHGDAQETAYNRYFLGEVARFTGNLSEAEAQLSASLAGYEAVGNRSAAAFCLNGLGLVYAALGDTTRARVHLERGLSTFREAGHKMGQAIASINLGKLQIEQGDFPAARATLDAGHVVCLQIGHRWGTATCLMHLGELARAEERHADAKVALTKSLTILTEIGQRRAAASCLIKLAVTIQELGDAVAADRRLTEAETIIAQLQDQALATEIATVRAALHGASREDQKRRGSQTIGQHATTVK